MKWFQFGRTEGFPTHYADLHTSASVDVLTVGIIFAFVIVSLPLFVILPAYSLKWRISKFFQIIIALFIGAALAIGNFGENWETGKIWMKGQYKAGSPSEIKAHLGIHIGLRGINITLKGQPIETHGDLEGETINYNEEFSWIWEQGRFGFGKYAGRISRDFREGALNGLPYPILQVAEYFTFDGEGIRFGRYYRQSGWYSHILMWTGLTTWLISLILFCFVVRPAGYLIIGTGILQILAIVVWRLNRNPIELSIPFEAPDGVDEVFLETKYGNSFYLVVFNGGLCILLGVAIVFLDMIIPDTMCNFFGIDPLTIYEEAHLNKAELTDKISRGIVRSQISFKLSQLMNPSARSTTLSMELGKLYEEEPKDEIPQEEYQSHLVMKRGTMMQAIARMKKPKALPRLRRGSGEGMQLENMNHGVLSDEEEAVRIPLLPPRKINMK